MADNKAPLSFAVRGAAPLDELPRNADGSGPLVGIDGEGWVGELVFKAMAPGGSFDASKVTITVDDPGFDAAGNPVVRTRTIRGGKVLRRQFPNHATSMIEVVGSDVLVRFSLSEYVFAGSVIKAVTVAAGAYADSIAGSPDTTAQNSARPYPKPLFAWLNHPYERAAGATLRVEAYALHQLARYGRQIACIRYQASDGTNSTPVATAGAVSLSTLVTGGKPPECYAADLDLAALSQGATCNVNALVYPWIGDAASVLNLQADGVAMPTSLMQARLPFVCDRLGTYGGVYAYLRLGASGGVASTDAAVARASPFGTFGACLDAIRTANATRGHADLGGGIVRCMDNADGSTAEHVLQTNASAPGACWYRVEKDPLALSAVQLTNNANFQFVPEMMKIGDIDVSMPAGNFLILTNQETTGRVAFDGARIAYQQGRLCDYTRRIWMRNVTLTSPLFPDISGEIVSHLGCDYSAYAFNNKLTGTLIGCVTNGFGYADYAATDKSDALDGSILANNLMTRFDGNSAILDRIPIVRGFGMAQNVMECATNKGPIALTYAADGTTKPIANLIDMHNLLAGERGNRMYLDADGASGIMKTGVEMYGIVDNWNQKGDVFPGSTVRGRTGGMAFAFGVMKRGMISLYGSKQGDRPAELDYYLGDHWPADSEFNATLNGTFPAFANYQAEIGGSAGPGGGDYHLIGETNSAYNRVAAGYAVFSHDLDGVARRNDGTGAAGPYERAPPPPIIPVNNSIAVTGVARVGRTLTAVSSWTNAQSITRQWLRNGSAISGATGVTYLQVEADRGVLIAPRETAISADGNEAVAEAEPVGPVEASDAPIFGVADAPPERTITLPRVQGVAGSGNDVPLGVARAEQPFDPSDERSFAIDLADQLRDGETITGLQALIIPAGAALGLTIDNDERPPFVDVDGLKVQFRPRVSSGFRENNAYRGAGTAFAGTVRVGTSMDDVIERSFIIVGRQQ